MDGQNINNNYQQPTPQEPKETDALAIVSLILGIAAIPMGCCFAVWGIVLNIVLSIGGIVCSVMSKNKAGKSGLATAGLVCSIIGIVFAIGKIVVIVIIVIIVAIGGSIAYDAFDGLLQVIPY